MLRPSLLCSSLLVLLGLALLLPACDTELEGDDAGECEDGADNDGDGYFDCLDSDCYGAPVCLEGGDDDDTAGDDDDTAADDDDTATDDDDTATDDDDSVGSEIPYIDQVTYKYDSGLGALVFSIEAYDPDANFGVPLLLWSVDGQSQPPINVGSTPLTDTAWFDVQFDGVTAGQTYSMLFAIQDADGNQSEGHFLQATAE